MRDNKWLKEKLVGVWQRYYSDVTPKNEVIVRFGRNARTRLGSIKFGRRKENPRTYITITGLFRDPEIPEFVIDAVLAHELAHYAHGFFSPHEKLHRYPHQHGVVDKELTTRGLGDILIMQKRWLKKNWREYLRHHAKLPIL